MGALCSQRAKGPLPTGAVIRGMRGRSKLSFVPLASALHAWMRQLIWPDSGPAGSPSCFIVCWASPCERLWISTTRGRASGRHRSILPLFSLSSPHSSHPSSTRQGAQTVERGWIDVSTDNGSEISLEATLQTWPPGAHGVVAESPPTNSSGLCYFKPPQDVALSQRQGLGDMVHCARPQLAPLCSGPRVA